MWLRRFGEKRHPRELFYREFYGHQKVDPQIQIDHLSDYLRVTPYLAPEADDLNVPTIRHPDLSPSNILISDNGDITGVIDWQHASVLPLFLQAKIPKYFQNYGDEESENFVRPKLAENFATMSSDDKAVELETFRRRQLHYFYLGYTSQYNKRHFHALGKPHLVLRNQLYDIAGRPWEGDNTSLQSQLMKTVAQWSDISATPQKPPIGYTEEEVKECLDRDANQKNIDEQMQRLREDIGVSIDGLVMNEEFESAVERAQLVKDQLMEDAVTEDERREIDENWPFQDHDEID